MNNHPALKHMLCDTGVTNFNFVGGEAHNPLQIKLKSTLDRIVLIKAPLKAGVGVAFVNTPTTMGYNDRLQPPEIAILKMVDTKIGKFEYLGLFDGRGYVFAIPNTADAINRCLNESFRLDTVFYPYVFIQV